MSFRSAVSEFFNPTTTDPKDAKPIAKPGVSSNRVMLIVAFGALLVVRSLLTEQTMMMLAGLLAMYLLSATITTVFRDRENGKTERLKLTLAWRDGKLDADEAALLGVKPPAVNPIAVAVSGIAG